MVNFRKIHNNRTEAGRQDLAGEHPSNDLLQILLLLVFLAVWGSDSFWLKLTTFPAGYVPLYLRVMAGAFILFWSAYLARQGLKIIFNEERAVPTVVRQGPFARVRHPIYLASVLFYVGLTAFTFSLAALALCVIAAIYYNFAALYEEKLLIAKHGNEYKKYMSAVPRWFPKFKS